jgi:ATP-dependent RNA helicase HelY
MAVNLIAAYPREEAERLLNASFAQFRDTRRRETLEDQVARDQERLDRLRDQATCHRGDIWALLHAETVGRHAAMEKLAVACATGDVLEWHEHGSDRRFVVAARGTGKRPRLLLISHDARLVRIGPDRLPDSTAIIGRISLPAPFRPRDAGYRHRLAERLGDWIPEGPPQRPHLPGTEDDGPASCPDLDDHLAAARAALRLERGLQRNRRRLAAVSGGLVPAFRAMLGLLDRWGYANGWKLTPAGTRLRSIYNEMGLADRIWESWERLSAAETDVHLPPTRAPEAGFAEIAYRWATGDSLDDLFEEDGVGVGDFVRNCRQLIDLLRQLRDVAPGLVPSADKAIAAIDRGVVAAVALR